MPPFAQFRLWLREGPRAERWAAVLATAVVLTLLAFALVPVATSSSSTGFPVSGPTSVVVPPGPGSHHHNAGPTSPAQTTPTTPALPGGPTTPPGTAVSGGRSATTPGSRTPEPATSGHPAKPGRSAKPASDCAGATLTSGDGITPTEVKVDVATVQLAGAIGDAAFNIPSDQNGIIEAIANYINHHGGVACGRKLAVKIYQVNPLDSNNQQSSCLKMAQDKPIAVINLGSYVTPVSQQCFISNHVPLETNTSPGATQAREAYPYLFSPIASSEEQVRDGILGAAAHGFFKAPKFKKLAIIEDSCLPSANAEIAKDLASVGVKSSQIVVYTLSCELIGSPTQILAAVIKAHAAGASTVFLASTVFNNENYVGYANQQHWYPTWLTSDYGTTTTGNGASKWTKNFNGAIAITSTRSGELNSGIHSPRELLCDKILLANKLPGIKNENTDDGASSFCDLIFFLAQAINNDGVNPSPTSMVEHLGTMGRFQSAYDGDSVWNRPGQLTGGSFQREIEYHSYCRCWKTVTAFGPAY
ncbi:MAG TPA: hypothetical protein VHD58_00685 [Mycobacteriales bacterium]|nr:hypothetical protein [Mycobacteriales bacterium]